MMESMAGQKSGLTWAVHLSVVALVALWLFPTIGLLVSSFRNADQIASSGWWSALSEQEQQRPAERIQGEGTLTSEGWQIAGRLFAGAAEVSDWGTNSRTPQAYAPGEVVELG